MSEIIKMINLSIVLPDNRLLLLKSDTSLIGWDFSHSRYMYYKSTVDYEYVNKILKNFNLPMEKRKQTGVRVLKLCEDFHLNRTYEKITIIPFVVKLTESCVISYSKWLVSKAIRLEEIMEDIKKEINLDEDAPERKYSDITVAVINNLRTNNIDIKV